MGINVKKLDERHADAWSAYVSAHPQGTLFHTLMWRDAVAEAFDHSSHYLMAWRDEQLVGVFPLMRVTSRLAGTILVSVPYAVYGGTLADDDEAHRALLAHAQKLADRLNAQWLDIRSREPQWAELPVVQRYVTFRKELPNDPAEVLDTMPRKARAASRQARERFCLEASFDDAHLETVWKLYSQSMRRVASPNYPTRFFESLVRRTEEVRIVNCGLQNDIPCATALKQCDVHKSLLESSGTQRESCGSTVCDPHTEIATVGHVVQLVTHRGRPIAGLISLVYRGVMMPYFSGCDERFEKYHPNNFLYLTAMEEGVRMGCHEFDFGRTRVDNAGAYNFKKFQGFEPTPLHYQYYVPHGGRAPNLHPANPHLALARRVWPKLPLAVTRPLGAWLSKSIPG